MDIDFLRAGISLVLSKVLAIVAAFREGCGHWGIHRP
jgi:hypothetical protein